jgi:hypothetical protein
MDTILIALPGLLFSSISALPLVLGVIAAMRHLRAATRYAYLRNLIASTAAGAAALALLWGSLFGNDLSASSTAALIFAVAPFYAAIAQGIAYGIAAAAFRKPATPQAISLSARSAMLVPLLLLAILMFGLIKSSVHGNDLAVAERASDPKTLQRLFEQSRIGKADPFGVPLFLAQNPATPPEILSELAKHEHPAVRAQVASNPRTPEQVVASLRNDCASFVRKAVVQRLGPSNTPEPTSVPTGVCALARWR